MECIDQGFIVTADDLLLGSFLCGIVINDAVTEHIDAHICRGLIRALILNCLKETVENREDLDVTVVVDGRDAVCLEVERINHVDIIEICRCGFIGEVHRVIQRKIPDRECFKLCITGFDSLAAVVIELRDAGSHLSGTRTRGCYNNQLTGCLDVVVLAETLRTDDEVHIGRITGNRIVEVGADAVRFQLPAELICRRLMRILGNDNRSDIEIQCFQCVDNAKQFLIVGNAGVSAQLGMFDIIGVNAYNQLYLVLEFRKKLNLVVRLITGKDTCGVKVFKHLAAEFEIQFSVEHLNAFKDLISLQLKVLFGIKCDRCHRGFLFSIR